MLAARSGAWLQDIVDHAKQANAGVDNCGVDFNVDLAFLIDRQVGFKDTVED